MNSASTSGGDLVSEVDDAASSFRFTAEQYRSLLALIQPASSTAVPSPLINFASVNQNTSFVGPSGIAAIDQWILDTGAIDQWIHLPLHTMFYLL